MKISIEYVRYFKEDGVQQFEWRPMFIHDNTLNFSEIIPSLINFNKIRLTSDCNAVQLQTDEIQFLSKQSQDMVCPNDQVLALSYYQLYHYVSVLVDLENREDWMRETLVELDTLLHILDNVCDELEMPISHVRVVLIGVPT